MLRLEKIGKCDPRLLENAKDHYSQPKGFVGRSLCYAVIFDDKFYGTIVAGSSTKHLPNRSGFVGETPLNNIVNNTFFHIEGPYPIRNFAQKVLKHFRIVSQIDWFVKYGDEVKFFESLVEFPRTGEVYKRDGWKAIGLTKGYTCKRVAGKGTDSWGGKRVWDRANLRPKFVFLRVANYE